MKAGEIGLVDYPSLDGTADSQVRPVLILKVGPTGHRQDEVVLVAHVTGSPKRVQYPLEGDLLLKDWKGCGLHCPSVVRCRQVAGVPPRLVLEIIGEVDVATLVQAQDLAKAVFPA